MKAVRSLLACAVLLFILAPLNAFDISEQAFYPLDTYDPEKAYYPDDKWYRLGKPELAGWSSEKLESAAQYAKKIHSDALLVIHNGVIVMAYGDCTERYKLHSIRKSLMSVMYGIFVDKGSIDINKTLDELEIDDHPPLEGYEKRASVRDLLMSKSGIYHPAAYETKSMITKRPERGSHAPGTYWHYNNWDFNALVSIFNQETGYDFFKAFKRYLAEPLQMEHFRIKDTKYRFEKEKSIHPAYLFRMSAVDLARIGLLYLRDGMWKGKAIVSKDWISQSTSAQHVWNKKHSKGYGYMWKAVEDGYYAAGVGGQRMFVAPKYQLVIVHQSDTRGGKRIKSRKIWNLYKKLKASMIQRK